MAIIGHGWRRRQTHDWEQAWIRVRRGLCTACRLTLTILPAWCVPGSHYSFPYRRKTLDRLAAGETVERAAPDCRELDRAADESTVRRWLGRRKQSLAFLGDCLANTLLAWDWFAAGRILIPEINSS